MLFRMLMSWMLLMVMVGRGQSQADWAFAHHYRFTQPAFAEAMAISPDDDRYVLGREEIGGNAEQILLLKVDQAGELQWGRRLGENDGLLRPRALEVLANDDVLVIGSLESNGLGGADAWLARFSENGNLLWQRHYGTFEYEELNAAGELSDGRLVVTGADYQSGGYRDALVAILSAEGIPESYASFAGTDYDYGFALAVNADDEILLAGRTTQNGQTHFWAAKLLSTLAVEWQVAFAAESGAFSYLESLRLLDGGDILMAGRSGSQAAGWVLDAAGNLVEALDWGPGEVTDIELDLLERPLLLSGGSTLLRLSPDDFEVESSLVLDPAGGINSAEALRVDALGRPSVLGYRTDADSSKLVLCQAFPALNDGCVGYAGATPTTQLLAGDWLVTNLPVEDPDWEHAISNLPVAVLNPDRWVACSESCEAPLAGFSYSIDALTVSFTETSTGEPLHFEWDFGADTAQSPQAVYTFPEAGTYQVCLTVENDCGTDTYCETITLELVNRQENPGQAVGQRVFPNPTPGVVYVESASQIAGWQLFDAQGQELQRGGNAAPAQDLELDLSRRPTGIYYLRIQSEAGKVSVIRLTKSGK